MRPTPTCSPAAAAIALCLALTSCVSEPSGPFPLTTLDDWSIDLTVLDEGAPAAGVQVQLRATLQSPTELPEAGMDSWERTPTRTAMVWRGRTSQDGRLHATLPFPATVMHVELLLTAPGRRGPYTDEDIRDELGTFAPASLLSVNRRELRDMTLRLAALEPR